VGKVVRIGEVGAILDGLDNAFKNGEIEEICVIIKGKDSVQSMWSERDTFFYRVGMVETMKNDMFRDVNEEISEAG